MLASSDLTPSPDFDSVRPRGSLVLAVAECGYNQGRADVWFLTAMLLAGGAAYAFYNGDKVTPLLIGGAFGSMLNAYDSARNS